MINWSIYLCFGCNDWQWLSEVSGKPRSFLTSTTCGLELPMIHCRVRTPMDRSLLIFQWDIFRFYLKVFISPAARLQTLLCCLSTIQTSQENRIRTNQYRKREKGGICSRLWMWFNVPWKSSSKSQRNIQFHQIEYNKGQKIDSDPGMS